MLRFASWLALLLAAVSAFAQSDPRAVLTVGTASARRGQMATGVIQVPAGPDAASEIPVIVINGARPGPVLSLVAGSHGTEYASIIALEHLATVSPAELSGSLIIVPLVNVASFQQVVPHLNPVDRKNMNRFYPGNPQGTQTERACWQITRQVIEPADYVIDFHGGDLDEDLRPYAYWMPTGNAAQDKTSREMALAFGLDHIIIVSGRPRDPNASVYLDNTASLRGKPSLIVEAGRIGRVDADDLHSLVSGTVSVMAYLHMLDRPVRRIENPVWFDKLAAPASDATGIFYPLVQRGAYVAQGAKIGYVTDYFGKTVADIRSPVSGVVLYIRGVPSVNKGDAVASIGVVAASPPN